MTAPVPTGNTYDKYGSTNPIERRLLSGFVERLERSLPADAPRRILEVGVGEGEIAERVARRYPGAETVGLDLLDDELAQQWRSRDLPGVFGDLTALPFPDATFDLVLAIEVLEHVTNPRDALREIARVATGTVVLSVPWEPVWRIANMVRGKYWSAWGNTPGHVQHWSRRGFAGLVGTELDVRHVHTPPPWTMVVARAGASASSAPAAS